MPLKIPRQVAYVIALILYGTVVDGGNATSANAKQCDWYVVLGCFSTQSAAIRRNDALESGYILATSDGALPMIGPGLFCVVKGPSSRQVALADALSWRDVVPDVYVKRASKSRTCQLNPGES